MLNEASREERMALWMWASFGALLSLQVAVWLLLNGYRFGIFDQSIHLPYLLREMDPSFLRGDVLVDAYTYHPSLFWRLQALFTSLVPVETLYLALHVVSVAAMLAGTAALARALLAREHGPWAALLAPCLVLLSKPTIAAIPMLDPLVLNRTFVLGPHLFALALGIQRRYHAALFIVGLTFLIHPTTSMHVAFLVWLAALADPERRRAALTGTLVCLAAASPLLALMLLNRSFSGVPFPPPPDWILLTRMLLGLHHYPSEWGWYSWMLGLAPLLVLAGALRARRSRPVEIYLVGIAILFVVGTLGAEVLTIPSVLHLHVLQSTRLLSFLAAACGSRWILDTWPAGGHGNARGWAVAVLVTLTQFPIPGLQPVILLVLLGVVLLNPPKRELATRVSPGAILLLTLVLGGIVSGVRRYVLHAPPEFQPRFETLQGARLMHWAREHLPRDAVVAIPPYLTEPLTGFRYGTGRSIVGTLKDGGEVSFSIAFMKDWKERIEALCDCKPFVAPGGGGLALYGVFTLPQVVLDGYRKADAERFRSFATRFGATHAVVEAKGATQPDLPLEYEDDEFKLYRIRP
ncbi:DUF6798 domain-containing protein [Pyxidicoccus sp. MSG2]|uniref:DUF6798 domain-containing protein n=1 Tax=Pyxidicoccus sp. MSG2 TaxID=2996790 RepID=UPI002270DD42|nr:DUF6798 domain-containing protein [Pyxidicoccus sp. MSG2]MCY1022986.1 hypothetical protein [Pyxidicoccus sp. MSG2]